MNLHLKVAILSRNLTQTEVAKRTHIAEARLSRIVRGHQPPNARERRALSKVLRMGVAQLFPSSESVSEVA